MSSLMVVLIVRNEQGRVGRALESVRQVADRWLVVDTGSTDETMAEVRATTGSWPGLMIERPWRSFGDNRTELLEIARSIEGVEWLLTIDADHTLEQAEVVPSLLASEESDALLVPFASEPLVWTPRIIRADKPWVYRGTTREFLDCEEPFTERKVDSPRIRDHADGASRANKYQRDAEILRNELQARPDDARRWYYLGESYRGLGQFELAAQAYTNCALTTKAPEERYLALTMSGEMLDGMGEGEQAVERYLLASQERPARREALLFACRTLNRVGRGREVLELLSDGVARPLPVADLGGVIPGAYGELMRAELIVARESSRPTRPRRRHK